MHEQANVEDGEFTEVLIDNDETLKKVKHQSNNVIVIPDNNQFKPMVLTDDFDAG
ncbi:S24 family peptidase [Apilactobacillus kunkeei]|uniref:S24 family peptidase n=1 Tax=Apilactobacillus kunkeei TaxID=148814 RepID=UPI004033498A